MAKLLAYSGSRGNYTSVDINNAADLISKCLKWVPKDRISAENALKHPFFEVPLSEVKDAIDRRRRKLRDIEDGQILVRDQLFRELPPRGREHKRPRRTGQ